MNVAVRLAKLEDLAFVQNCANHAYSPYIQRLGRVPAPMLADFSAQIARNQIHIATLANDNVGFAVFYPQSDCLFLENIAVLPTHTGKGIGRFLLHYIEQHAHETGLDRVELYTNIAMHENLAMYAHLGYKEFKRAEQDGFHRVFLRKRVRAR